MEVNLYTRQVLSPFKNRRRRRGEMEMDTLGFRVLWYVYAYGFYSQAPRALCSLCPYATKHLYRIIANRRRRNRRLAR
jgi:hypothetical protein